ncbi:MAG: bifunctional riboflavin kinase/FAD synthetase [Deferribacterales bacterium]
MKFIDGVENFDINCETSLTIGNFDGIHIGHAKIIDTTVAIARDEGLSSVVITFDPHPSRVFGHDIQLLMSLNKKNEILSNMGVDYHILIKFNKEIMNMDPEVFVRELLIKKLNAKFIVVGYDYRFGARRKGDFELLKTLSRRYNYTALKIDKIVIDDMTVSSSNIRKLLLNGNLLHANRMLGRYYLVEGEVERGDGLGRLLKFPTANIKVFDYLIPKYGVYATLLKVDDMIYKSVTNVGIRPTIPGSNELRVESYIFDFDGNIYGKKVELFFVDYLREEMKFNDFELLKKQIEKDCIVAREVLKNI